MTLRISPEAMAAVAAKLVSPKVRIAMHAVMDVVFDAVAN